MKILLILLIGKHQKNINLYLNVDNITYSDYIDRITFQKQIWVFNEMSSLVKTMYNNHIYHNFKKNEKIKRNIIPVK